MISLRQTPPTDAQIIQWSADNPGFRFEYVNGAIIVSPTTLASGLRTSALNTKLGVWAKANGYRSLGSNTLFHFSDLQVSPDEVLIRSQRIATLSADERDRVSRLVPDVAVEIVSKSQGYGKERGGVIPKCKAMSEADVGYVLMLDPYAQGANRIVEWGNPPPNFPSDWDDVLDA